MKIFNKILIANRGEIAVRIIKTLKKLSVKTVAVYSVEDKDALHVKLSDEAYLLNGSTLRDTYLDIEKIIRIAKESDCDAIHPGYGFLSENPAFARRISEEAINFIGPTADAIELMGDKLIARQTVKRLNVPLIEGIEGTPEEILIQVEKLPYPLLVKAAAGGGGKAMRIVRTPDDLKEALETSAREAYHYFGDKRLYAEKYFENARHIEIQVLADHYGKILILGERECSLQRRYQKIIEEAPSAFLSDDARKELFKISERIVKEIGYVNAGTLEFLVDENSKPYFLEMNTRIQVEHPVTEMVTGIDLVEQQVLIAAGNKLSLNESEIGVSGHAIEARIYAENPEKDFMPSPGDIYAYEEPFFPGLRIDSGINTPVKIFPDYDPMISKVICHGHDRHEAIIMLEKALRSYVVSGTETNREYLLQVLKDEDFLSNRISTTYIETNKEKLINSFINNRKTLETHKVLAAWFTSVMNCPGSSTGNTPWNNMGFWRQNIRKSVVYNGQQYDLFIKRTDDKTFHFDYNKDEQHIVELKSCNKSRTILEIDNEWIVTSSVSGMAEEDILQINGTEYRLKPLDFLPQEPLIAEDHQVDAGGLKAVKSPLHGKLVKLNVSEGIEVKKGDHLFTLDAMKIENKVVSPYKGCVKEIRVNEGDQVSINQVLITIDNCNENN